MKLRSHSYDVDSDSDVDCEDRESLSELISNLDNCAPGSLMLNILEIYVVFIVTLYFFIIISQ